MKPFRTDVGLDPGLDTRLLSNHLAVDIQFDPAIALADVVLDYFEIDPLPALA